MANKKLNCKEAMNRAFALICQISPAPEMFAWYSKEVLRSIEVFLLSSEVVLRIFER